MRPKAVTNLSNPPNRTSLVKPFTYLTSICLASTPTLSVLSRPNNLLDGGLEIDQVLAAVAGISDNAVFVDENIQGNV